MIGIALPLIAVGALFGVMHFSNVSKGQKKAGIMWLFIILSALGGLLVLISSIIGFAVGNNLFNSDHQRNVRAAGALALLGALLFIIAFIVLLVLNRKGKIQLPGKKTTMQPTKP
jgi:hypothetical protein